MGSSHLAVLRGERDGTLLDVLEYMGAMGYMAEAGACVGLCRESACLPGSSFQDMFRHCLAKQVVHRKGPHGGPSGPATRLHFASQAGHVGRVRDLLDARADINAPCGVEKLTPVMLAAREGREEAAHLLLDRGADMRVKGGDGTTLVHHAAAGGAVSVLRRVLDGGGGADINCIDSRHHRSTPLDVACMRGREAAAHFLLDSGAECGRRDLDNKSSNDLLESACRGGLVSVIDRALAAGADINVTLLDGGLTPLMTAIKWGKEAAALHLLGLGADGGDEVEDESGNSALHHAAQKGFLTLVRRLLSAGASLDRARSFDDASPTMLACRSGKEGVAHFLLDRMGADWVGVTDGFGRTLLHHAAAGGALSVIRRLVVDLGAGIDVRSLEEDEVDEAFVAFGFHFPGATPLVEACYLRNEDAALLLLELGASAVRGDRHRCGPLHIASREGHLQVIRLLVQKGADINEATVEVPAVGEFAAETAMAPLAWACRFGKREAAMLLLDLGADVLAFKRGDGEDPLPYSFSASLADVRRRIETMQAEGRQKIRVRKEAGVKRKREAEEAEEAR